VAGPFSFVPFVDIAFVDWNRELDAALARCGALGFCQGRRKGGFELAHFAIKWNEIVGRKQTDELARVLAVSQVLRTFAQAGFGDVLRTREMDRANRHRNAVRCKDMFLDRTSRRVLRNDVGDSDFDFLLVQKALQSFDDSIDAVTTV